MQQIVVAAKVSKPALYYHFGDKAGLFQALVDQAHDERYRLMREASAGGGCVAERLERIITTLFEFLLRNQELMRLAFVTAFQNTGESPCRSRCLAKVRRNFEFLKALLKEGQTRGELDKGFDVDELAMGFYGQLNIYVMGRLCMPDFPLNGHTARRIVRLFLEGAQAVPSNVGRGSRHRGGPRGN